MEPDTSTLQRHSAFITLIAGKRADIAGGGDGSTPIVRKMAALLNDIASKGLALISANRQCVTVATGDIKKHLDQQGFKLPHAVVTLRAEIQKLVKNMAVSAAELKALGGGDSVSAGLAELLEWKLPAQISTELSNEAFDDIISRRAATYRTTIEDLLMKFETSLQEHYNSKALEDADHFSQLNSEQSWKSAIFPDTPPADILKAAKPSICVKLPIKSLKQFAHEFEQDRQTTLTLTPTNTPNNMMQ